MWWTTKLYIFTANTLDTFDCEGKIALRQLCHQRRSIKPKLHFQTHLYSIKGTISKCYKGIKWTLTFLKRKAKKREGRKESKQARDRKKRKEGRKERGGEREKKRKKKEIYQEPLMPGYLQMTNQT